MIPLDIERATIETWPAAVTEDRDGWLLLAAGGVTGRVNACWPLEWRGGDIEAAIDGVEHWYADRAMAPRFKLTDGAIAPPDLPERLAQRGYEAVSPTLVMTRALAPQHYEAVALATDMPATFDQALKESTPNADDLAERRAIAHRLPPARAFALRMDGERALAIGASAIAGSLAGVFLMRTVPEARRQGHALHVLRALLNWAHTQGAAHAFLQVEASNAAAVALYEREGFTALTTYRYWRKA